MAFSITKENCRICLECKPDSKLISDLCSTEVPSNTIEIKTQSYLDIYKFVAEIHGDSVNKLTTPPPSSLFFPERICRICVAQLKVAYDLRRKILKSETVLKKLIQLYSDKDDENTVKKRNEIQHNINEVEPESYGYKQHEQEKYDNETIAETLPVNSNIQINQDDGDLSDVKSLSSESPVHSRSNSPLFSYEPDKDQCKDCGKIVSLRFLAQHRANHRRIPNREKSFACDICDRKFLLKVNLNKHKRSHSNDKISHSNDKRYKCPYCEEKFRYWATRKYHIVRHHTGEWPFICEVCGKRFRQSSQYYTHVRLHSGLSPYACELCDRRFRTQLYKQRHMLTHSDAKNFHCNVCGKAFKTEKSMRVHIRTLHDQEKNYVCAVCNKAFSQNHVLRTHLLKNHPEYQPPPPGTIVSIRAIERIKEQNRIISYVSKNDP